MKYYEVYFKFGYNKRMRRHSGTFDKAEAEGIAQRLQGFGAEIRIKVTECE